MPRNSLLRKRAPAPYSKMDLFDQWHSQIHVQVPPDMIYAIKDCTEKVCISQTKRSAQYYAMDINEFSICLDTECSTNTMNMMY